jgi:riboflavin kinase
MSLPWVRDGVRQLIGFTPYPGTLNIRLDTDAVAVWRRISEGRAVVLAPPSPETCGARLFRAVLSSRVDVAVVVPDVTRYGADLLELIAAVHLRSLGFRDDDPVTLHVRPGHPETNPAHPSS